jgi:hypothetical protein
MGTDLGIADFEVEGARRRMEEDLIAARIGSVAAKSGAYG